MTQFCVWVTDNLTTKLDNNDAFTFRLNKKAEAMSYLLIEYKSVVLHNISRKPLENPLNMYRIYHK